MRRLFFAALAALMLATAVPAAAITYGQPDNGAHPQVGLVVFYRQATPTERAQLGHDLVPLWRCSGTLLTSTLLLTAGHCTAPDGTDTPTQAQVWFQDSVPSSIGYPWSGGTMGTPFHPAGVWASFPDTHDVGAVKLNKQIKGVTYATLAPLGFLDQFATRRGLQDLNLTAVGYGLQQVVPFEVRIRQRYAASQQITDLVSALTDGFNVRSTNAPGNGTGDGITEPGGTCFGDSGGPAFYGTSLMIVAVTSFGQNSNCKGGDYAYRTDIAFTQDWLRETFGYVSR